MTRPKSGSAAILLSLFWTGLGQLYAGRVGRGVVMMLATPLIWAVSFAGGVTGVVMVAGHAGATRTPAIESPGGAIIGLLAFAVFLLPVLWWVWGMGDAKRQCDAVNQSLP